jgi:YlmC/YmxH family sporulation protein
MRLSDLQNKDIVNIEDGKKIGKIIDVVIDDKGNMLSLIMQRVKILNIFPSGGEVEVKWNQIKKIGEDVILISI